MMMMTMLFENRFDDVELDEFDMDCMTAVRFFKLIEKIKMFFFVFFKEAASVNQSRWVGGNFKKNKCKFSDTSLASK
jgi:hypothetical protein